MWLILHKMNPKHRTIPGSKRCILALRSQLCWCVLSSSLKLKLYMGHTPLVHWTIKRTKSESSLLYKNDGKKSGLPSLFRINIYLGFVVKNLPKDIGQQYTRILLRKKGLIRGTFNKLMANILYGKKKTKPKQTSYAKHFKDTKFKLNKAVKVVGRFL